MPVKPRQVLFKVVVFLASFLFFSIEPMTGKLLLPIFGGSSSSWLVLMLFFTTTMLLGYIYSHVLNKLPQFTQFKIHIPITLISVFTIFISTSLDISDLIITNNPILNVLIIAIIRIGLPFFILSTTSLNLQIWYSKIYQNRDPYFLYKISNFGALIGLISYPLIIEPNLTLSHQQTIWNILFILTCILTTYLISISSKGTGLSKSSKLKIDDSNYKLLTLWFILALVPNLLLFASTSFLTQGITGNPLLWVVPLLIYLTTYIIGFNDVVWFSREFLYFILLVLIMAFSFTQIDGLIKWNSQALELSLIFSVSFLSGLVFHHKLYELRPHPSNLTTFYVTIGLGGITAAIICSVIAPTLFSYYFELPITLLLTIILTIYLQLTISKSLVVSKEIYLVFALYCVVVLGFGNMPFLSYNPNIIKRERNFYGVVTVEDNLNTLPKDKARTLYNGNINHGFQYLSREKEIIPTSYYSADTGIGRLIYNRRKISGGAPMRIGVIGLGVGTLSAYCHPNDYFRYYEINNEVVDIARNKFTFLKNCILLNGEVEIINGDARTSLASENSQHFDILVVDAFTDDAIPTHLLTTEALETYLSHMAPKGIIAFHITNRYLDLKSVLNSVAKHLNLVSYAHSIDVAEWFFMMKNEDSDLPREFTKPIVTKPNITPWTDDYSNILSAF